MKDKYTLNNSNSLLVFVLIFIIVFIWTMVNLIQLNYLQLSIGILLTAGTLTFGIKTAKKKVIELILDKEKIIRKRYFSDKKSNDFLSYSDINSITLKQPIDVGTSLIVFNFLGNNKEYKITMNLPGNTDEIVDLVLWLKQRNSNIKTFVLPKGTELHSRLRQELLGFEY